ncbi:MAG: hypothetical protein AAFZ04_15555 [Pseudomonadota bacterium]
MSDATKKPDPLDAEFAALAAQDTPPRDDLIARVMADADAVQADFMALPAPAKRSAGRRVLAVIGGWPSLAGLATAGLAGVWIGMAQPALLVAGSDVLLSGDASGALNELDTGFGLSLLDGGL